MLLLMPRLRPKIARAPTVMGESGARLPRRAPDACGVAAGRTRSAASGWKRPFPTMHGSQHLTAVELCHEYFVILIPV
jgi:hypothetical protein